MVPVGFVTEEGPRNLEPYFVSTLSTIERISRSAPSPKPNGITFEDEEVTRYTPKPKGTCESEEESPSNGGVPWRKLRESIFGHAPYTTQIIDQVNGNAWQLLAIILQSVLLSISNTIFISNPLSGLIILSTVFYSTPSSAFLGLISLLSGIFTSLWVHRLPHNMIRGGSITFNCFLLGSIVGPLVGATNPTFNEVMHLIPVCIATGVFVIFCWGGFHGLLSQVNIPVLNAPCNALALLFIYSGLANYYLVYFSSSRNLFNENLYSENFTLNGRYNFLDFNETQNFTDTKNIQNGLDLSTSNEITGCIDWYRILGGIILAQGQIFQTNSIAMCSIIYLCALLYSPILFIQQLLGSAIGTFIGFVLSEQAYTDVYDGSWGFNSLLTSAAIGGFLIAYNLQSFLLSVIGSVLSALLYGALVKNGFPAIGIPFMLITWLFLPLSTVQEDKEKKSCYTLHRVTEFTTPEINLQCFNMINPSDNKYRRPKSSVLPL